MQCAHFDARRCLSCTQILRPYGEQLGSKQQHCAEALREHDGLEWLPAVASRESGFRNKAKMAVSGTAGRPVLGILDRGGVDLSDCALYPDTLQACFPVLARFITLAGIEPYDVGRRSGELKQVLVTESPDGELMVRFVLRSQEPVTRIRKHLPWLREALPSLVVVSVNLLPEHRAVVEGDREILLTEQATLTMRVNHLDLFLRPQSFFQTNTEVAAALYRQAAAWVDEVSPRSVWDLYCGVGGFALHCAAPGRAVLGVEISAEAVLGAEASARSAGLDGVRFAAGGAESFAVSSASLPDLVVVNPPRRGIGAELAGRLEHSSVGHVLYSSCNVASLARDLRAMPSLRPLRARLLDMFPHTHHYEVVTLLERVA